MNGSEAIPVNATVFLGVPSNAASTDDGEPRFVHITEPGVLRTTRFVTALL